MKKAFFTIAMLLYGIVANAQVVSTDYNSVITDENPTEATSESIGDEFIDFNVSYNSDYKKLGISYGGGVSNSLLYWRVGFGYSFGDSPSSEGFLGVGIHKRAIIADNFLIQGMLYPCIGISSYEEVNYDYSTRESSTKDKVEFTYGAAGNLAAGVKLATSKSGKSWFITVGYYVSAPKFKTEGMFDNGSWMLGLTIVK